VGRHRAGGAVIAQTHIECPASLRPVRRQAELRLTEASRMAPAGAPRMGFWP
jgi:hypothetical protein